MMYVETFSGVLLGIAIAYVVIRTYQTVVGEYQQYKDEKAHKEQWDRIFKTLKDNEVK